MFGCDSWNTATNAMEEEEEDEEEEGRGGQ
jgi:hypothetical protein